jgi:hypothetical protein
MMSNATRQLGQPVRAANRHWHDAKKRKKEVRIVRVIGAIKLGILLI